VSKNYRFVNRTRTHTFTLNLDLDFFELTTTLISTFIPIIPITIARMEEKWAIIASKYRYRINVDKAIKDKLVEFI